MVLEKSRKVLESKLMEHAERGEWGHAAQTARALAVFARKNGE